MIVCNVMIALSLGIPFYCLFFVSVTVSMASRNYVQLFSENSSIWTKKKHILCVLTFRNWLQFKLEYLANSHVQLWNSHADCSWEQKFTKLKCKYTPNVNSSDNCRYCNTAPIKNFIIETDNTESTLKNSANTIIWKLFMAKIGLRTSAHLSKSDNINTLSASRLPKRS